MISKIIQKEKERQKYALKFKSKHDWDNGYCESHRESLVSLKEYLEKQVKNYINDNDSQLKEDIKVLEEMIRKYK